MEITVPKMRDIPTRRGVYDKQMDTCICVAGKKIRIHSASKPVKYFCRNYLCEDGREADDEITMPREKSDWRAELLVLHERLANTLLKHDILLIHGAAVASEGVSCLFTGPSGRGKTTRMQRWLEEYPDSFVVNGDKPFIIVQDDRVLACGSPWGGKENLGSNVVIPLQAVFQIEWDEEGRGTQIQRLGPGEAFQCLYSQTHKPKTSEGVRKTLDLIGKMLRQVPVYSFRSQPTREAMRVAHDALYQR